MENRQATQEPTKDSPRNGKGQGCDQEEGQIDVSLVSERKIISWQGEALLWCFLLCWFMREGANFVH